MDKLERAEQMAKAIIEYLIKHKILERCPQHNAIYCSIEMKEEMWNKYIREAIYEFVEKNKNGKNTS